MARLAGLPTPDFMRGAAASAAFVTNYLVGTKILTLFQHTWSLAVEEHSYLALAGIVILARRDPHRSARLAFAVSLVLMAIAAARYHSHPTDWRLYLRSESRAPSILLSFAIAVHGRRIAAGMPASILPWVAPAAMCCALALAMTVVPTSVFCTVVTLLLSIAVNFVEHAHKVVSRPLQDPVLRWFGLISFSLYLWQQPFHAAHVTNGLSSIIVLPLAILLASGSFYLVETPARRLLKPARTAGRASV